MGRDQFIFDEDGFVLQCPEKNAPIDHRMLSANNQKGRSLHAIFDGDQCRKCSKLEQCPVRAPNHRERGCQPRDTIGDFRLEITPQLRLRDQMYADQQTEQWKKRYKIRSGVEATMSELKRSHGMGKLRVRRAARVCFAVACKVIKRWVKAHLGSPHKGKQGHLGIIFILLGAIWTIPEQIRRYRQLCRYQQTCRYRRDGIFA
jgi:Transposase DDE domain